MASDLNQLNQAQQTWLEKITQYGINLGYGTEVTKAMVMLAHQESDLGKSQHNLEGSSAEGLFQFMGPEHIQDELTGYRTSHPQAKYAGFNAVQVFKSNDATMVVMFDQMERWKQEFAIGYLPDYMRKQLHGHALEAEVSKDFNTYAYFRHNTSVQQTEKRLHAQNGITASSAEIDKYVDIAYQNAHNSFGSYKIPVSKELKASAELQVLHAGSGHVKLPNGFEVTLTDKNDHVMGVENTYLISQGKNQKYVSYEDARMVETRSTAFKDTGLNNQNIPLAAGSMVLMPNGDAVVNTANQKIAPFKLSGHGYVNAEGVPVMHKPPLQAVRLDEHGAIFSRQLALDYERRLMYALRKYTPKIHSHYWRLVRKMRLQSCLRVSA